MEHTWTHIPLFSDVVALVNSRVSFQPHSHASTITSSNPFTQTTGQVPVEKGNIHVYLHTCKADLTYLSSDQSSAAVPMSESLLAPDSSTFLVGVMDKWYVVAYNDLSCAYNDSYVVTL